MDQAVLLEVEVLQADQAAEDGAGQAAELAAVEMQRLQPLQALEGVRLHSVTHQLNVWAVCCWESQ